MNIKGAKKLVAALLTAGAVLLAAGLAGCGGKEEHVHTWNGGVTVQQATCTQDGEIVYTCEGCGEEKRETVAASGHDSQGVLVSDDPVGHYLVCPRCGEMQEGQQVTPHNFVAEEYVIQPQTDDAGVTKAGTQVMRCSDCGYETFKTIPVHTHAWDEGIITKAPTCTQTGEKTVTCTVCGYEKTGVTVEKTAHEFREERRQEGATEYGEDIVTYGCANCEEEYTVTDHAWGEYTTIQPTFFTEGSAGRICSVCGEADSETLPRKDSISLASDFASDVWLFGQADYSWGSSGESFNFTQATEGDGVWNAGDATIAGDRLTIQRGKMTVIAFRASEAVKIDLGVTFTGDNGTAVSLRIGVKDASDNLYKNPDFCVNSSTFTVDREYELKADDTIYLLFNYENGSGNGGSVGVDIARV